MAKFSSDVGQLMLDMQQIAEIPEDVIDEMLQAGSKVGVEAMRRSLRRMGLVKTGQLSDSLVAVRKVGKDGRIYYRAYSKGRRKAENRALTVANVRRVNPLRSHAKPPTNNEVGFVLEFGAPKRIQPRQWMRMANEESADDVVAAEFKIYDDWLKSKGF